MPKAEYTEIDLHVKDELERLFWIEVAKRKAHLRQPGTLLRLVTLRHELDIFFDGHADQLEFPFDEGTDTFFDTIQFHRCIEDTVADPQHVDLLRIAFDLYKQPALSVIENLSYYQGFRLADFSIVTDLVSLHDWWTAVTSRTGQNELAMTGKFSSMAGITRESATDEIWFEGDDSPTISIGDCIDFTSSFANPARIPIRIYARPLNTFATDNHEITIDGRILKDRIVLDFDLFNPLPSIRQIVLATRNAQAAALARREWTKLQAIIVSKDLRSEQNEGRCFSFLPLNSALTEKHMLMVEQKNAIPMIFALYCWDLVAEGKSNSQACKLATESLHNFFDKPYYEMKNASAALKKLGIKIKEYEPSQLPWYD